MSYPPSVTTVTVTGTWRYADGSTAVPTGTVSFTPNTTLQVPADNDVLPPKAVTAKLDPTGAISVVLMSTADTDVVPTGWAYQVVEQVGGQTRGYLATFPAVAPGQTYDLADIAPATSTPVFGYVLLASVGTVGGPAGPLDGSGKIPSVQMPFGTPAAVNSGGGSFGVNVSAGAPAPTAQNGPGSRTYLAGALLLAASQVFNANSVLATLPTAQRPAALGRWTVRTIGSNTQTVIAVDVDGTVKNLSAVTASGSGDILALDPINFVHA
jgi:hypothetical protein